MRKIGLLFLIFPCITAGCITSRTEYAPHGYKGGYSEKNIDDRHMVARFTGNAYTNVNDSLLFSQFRAIEICKEKKYKFTRIYESINLSSQQKIKKYSYINHSLPTYFDGSSENYGNAYYTNGFLYGGEQYGNSMTWIEVYNYPTFDSTS